MELKMLAWKDVREEFQKVNQELAQIIDEINPDKSYKLYLATYPYGSYSVKGGVLQIPTHKFGVTIPLTDPAVSNKIKDDLGYNSFTNPVCFVLQNTLEIFYIVKEHAILYYGLIPPGRLFSSWKVVSNFKENIPVFLWNITAGARSLFMLSKLSDTAGNKRLKKSFDLLITNKPKSSLEQWEIFRLLATHNSIKNPWQTQVLFFGKKWFEHLESPAFKDFFLYLLKNAWQGSNYFRQQFIWDLIYSLIQERKNIKAESYIINTVKHLISISSGEVPGFVPAIDNFAGPIDLLKDIYRDIYQLKHYEPIFMHPHYFNLLEKRPVYYSLACPTMHNFSVRPNEEQSKIQDLISIKSVMTKFLDEIQHGNLNISDTSVSKIPTHVQHKYFHSIAGFHQINQIPEIVKLDNYFRKAVDGRVDRFPVNSTFFKGCIQISALSDAI